jgi:hypothetical protein
MSESLGAVVFEKRPPWLLRLAGLLLGGAFSGFAGWALSDPAIEKGGPLVGLGIGLLLLFAGLHACVSRLRVHELGVSHRGFLGTKELRFDQVGAMSVAVVEQHTNGIYTGTSYGFGLDPLPGAKGSSISFNTTIRGEDDALYGLRDQVAGVVGRRILEALRTKGEAAWTPHTRFVGSQLEHRKSGLLGRKAPERFDLRALNRVEIEDGSMKIWADGHGEDHVVEEACSEVNFFPGYYAFETLRDSLRANKNPA